MIYLLFRFFFFLNGGTQALEGTSSISRKRLFVKVVLFQCVRKKIVIGCQKISPGFWPLRGGGQALSELQRTPARTPAEGRLGHAGRKRRVPWVSEGETVGPLS